MKRIPQRRCIGCGKSYNKKDLIRMVRGPGGEINHDGGTRLDGRGAYVCRSESCIALAIKRKGLDRSFRRSFSNGVYEKLRIVMDSQEIIDRQKVFSLLGMCRRSGNVVSGEFSTKKAVQEGRAKLVIISTDASEGTKKLFYDKCSYYRIPVYEFGTRDEIGHSIGCGQRVSAAILDEGFAKSLIERLENAGKICGGSQYGKNKSV